MHVNSHLFTIMFLQKGHDHVFVGKKQYSGVSAQRVDEIHCWCKSLYVCDLLTTEI